MLREGIDGGAVGDEGAGVGVLGILDDLVGGAVLHDAAQIHDRNIVGDVPRQGDVVADEDHRRVVVPGQVDQHVDDLGADRHVQHRHRLVGNDEAGVQEHGADDGNSLQLTAGQLVGIAAHDVLSRAEAAGLQGLPDDFQPLLHRSADVVVLQGPQQDLLDGIPGRKGVKGVLKHDLDLTAEPYHHRDPAGR